MPHHLLIPILSIIILIAITLVGLDYITKLTFLPATILYYLLLILSYLCVLNNPTYLPVSLRILPVAVCAMCSLFSINGIITRKGFYYVYQFELIDTIKAMLVVYYIVRIIDVIDCVSARGMEYAIFLLPYIPLFISCLKFQVERFNNKLLYCAVGFAILGCCIYDYIIYSNLFGNLADLSIVALMFFLRRQLHKRRTVFFMTAMVVVFNMSIYLEILKFFPKVLENVISVIGLIINIFILVLSFIKTKQMSIRKVFSPLLGVYTKKNILCAIRRYYELMIKNDGFVQSALVNSIEYAENNSLANIENTIKEDIENRKNSENKEIFDVVTVRRRPKLIEVIIDIIDFTRLHWRIFLSVLFIGIELIFFYPNINSYFSSTFKDNGIICIALDSVNYANEYSMQIVPQLSDKDSIDTLESYSEFSARLFKEQADEYKADKNTQLELQALSASLHFHVDYNVLYRRYLLYSALHYYEATISDIDALLSMEESEYKKGELLDSRSVFYMYYSHYNEALSDAELLYELTPSNENNAWIGACLIGIGNYNKAIGILNPLIAEDPNMPYWTYRMRGLAYLSLAENGQLQYLSNAESDILYAYNSEETSNNTLAYAKLCLYLGEKEKAFDAIQSVIECDPQNGRAYFWLSKYYEQNNDVINKSKALDTSRLLNYIGNEEY